MTFCVLSLAPLFLLVVLLGAEQANGVHASCVAPTGELCLKVGAFNCKTFGTTKMSNSTLAKYIAEIVQRYDILVLQEIRDASMWAQEHLLMLLRQAYGDFGMILSDKLGRSSYTEQYGFYFRKDRVFPIRSFQYDDGEDDFSDDFEREPFSVLFQVGTGDKAYEFAVMALHAKPTDAVAEIIHLDKVTAALKGNLSTDNVLLVGDLNADCSYCKESDLADSAIYSSAYKWLIQWSADTTVMASTDCAYDRIIGTASIMNMVAAGSAKVFRFDTDLRLKEDMAYAVSDHYPVEVELYILVGFADLSYVACLRHIARRQRGHHNYYTTKLASSSN